MKKMLFAVAAMALLFQACGKKEEKTVSGLLRSDFQTVINGTDSIDLWVLTNAAGAEVAITNFGGRIVSVMVPDKNGVMQDVVLDYDSIGGYLNNQGDFGATIGRYANRIHQGRFVLDGDTIQLPQNNFGHCLHGGPEGWQYKVFKQVRQPDAATLEMTLVSPDGDMNFPGTVTTTVTFKLTDDNAIDIQFNATTDKKTIINMCNHSYFNLSGNPANAITDHLLYVNAARFTPVDSTFMTTGAIDSVKATPMDFTVVKAIGAEIDNYDYLQLKNGNGYDHNWVLDTGNDLAQLAASLVSPVSGIKLEVYTNEPGIQVYTGNFLDGTLTGKKGIVYQQRAAVCLETQHYPDSPNKAGWPSVVLEPGQTYNSRVIYKFSVEQ
ncbi:MAG: galactose mutarotase [Paludibacter sp.]|nr:MAG: galactose mutarotase [Paludibacter sp.]